MKIPAGEIPVVGHFIPAYLTIRHDVVKLSCGQPEMFRLRLNMAVRAQRSTWQFALSAQHGSSRSALNMSMKKKVNK
jgi:hypothetical protein